MGPRETRARIPEILALVGFPPERGHEPMEDLSRGMQQKIALARALLTAPVLLLLDEPTTGLDPRSKLEVQDFIRQMREHHDSTILLCTHDMAEAEALADRIGILHQGELLCLESAEEIRQRYHADTLEQAFLNATGRSFEDEDEESTKGGTGMIRPEQGGALRRELIGFAGIVERNMYLIRRFAWWELAWFLYTVANTLTIVFIAKGIEAGGGHLDVNRTTIVLLIGAVIWSYLGLIFEVVTETVAWERWEGTIEYTFMAPISRASHLLGMGAFAVIYGVLRTALLFAVVAAFLTSASATPTSPARRLVLLISSVSFIGIGMMTAVLPLISPEKGTQLGFIAQGLLLVVSGVYYPVTVLPDWMQWLSVISPATYTLEGCRNGDPGRRQRVAGVARHLAAARDRRHRRAAGPGGVPARRALREAARPAQASG